MAPKGPFLRLKMVPASFFLRWLGAGRPALFVRFSTTNKMIIMLLIIIINDNNGVSPADAMSPEHLGGDAVPEGELDGGQGRHLGIAADRDVRQHRDHDHDHLHVRHRVQRPDLRR